MSDSSPGAADFQRVEAKVDKLAEAISKLVLVEERQMTQGQRIGAVEQRQVTLEAQQQLTDRKVDQWINRGIGLWFAVSALGVLAFKLLGGG